MGQYHYVVNLDRKEFLHPHKFGDGLKLLEQVNSQGGIMAALFVLLACSNGRGSGDIPDNAVREIARERNEEAGKFVEVVPDAEYRRLAAEYIGRWAGDRVAVVGDYAGDGDLPPEFEAGSIYARCAAGADGWRDISDDVLPIVERACGVQVAREPGWRRKQPVVLQAGVLPTP